MLGEHVAAELAELMPDRQIRHYPALLSTEAEARRWAARGAAAGSLVVAGYQAAPRGRGGVVWEVPADGVGFSIILRPNLLEHQEGRLYMWGCMALADLCHNPGIGWPDGVSDDGSPFGAVVAHAMIDLLHVEWAVITVMVNDAGSVPSETVGRVAAAVDVWMRCDGDQLREEYGARLSTTDRAVSAHLTPIGPNARRIEGRALGTDENCALRIETEDGAIVAVRPRDVGLLEVV